MRIAAAQIAVRVVIKRLALGALQANKIILAHKKIE